MELQGLPGLRKVISNIFEGGQLTYAMGIIPKPSRSCAAQSSWRCFCLQIWEWCMLASGHTIRERVAGPWGRPGAFGGAFRVAVGWTSKPEGKARTEHGCQAPAETLQSPRARTRSEPTRIDRLVTSVLLTLACNLSSNSAHAGVVKSNETSQIHSKAEQQSPQRTRSRENYLPGRGAFCQDDKVAGVAVREQMKSLGVTFGFRNFIRVHATSPFVATCCGLRE